MTDWPHAPLHRLSEAGAYMVTSGTHQKTPHFNTPERLDLLHDSLLQLAGEFNWLLQAWAVMSNHYHFVAVSPDDPKSLGPFLSKLHMTTAREINRLDGEPERKVWFQYWDSRITYQRSYLARLNYTHKNPAHHGLVKDAAEYRWCSAGWFERTANAGFRKTVYGFGTDRINIEDDF